MIGVLHLPQIGEFGTKECQVVDRETFPPKMDEFPEILRRAIAPLVRFPDCHECQSGERTPPERGILLRRLLAVKKWLEPPHMTHIVGFCSMWRMPGSCQNLEKSIQVAARADLAPPPVCPLFWSFCFYWISLYLLSDLWPQVISYLL